MIWTKLSYAKPKTNRVVWCKLLDKTVHLSIRTDVLELDLGLTLGRQPVVENWSGVNDSRFDSWNDNQVEGWAEVVCGA